MDFNEPVISHQQLLNDEVPNSTEHSIPAMARLEHDIDDVYSLIESKISTFWNSASRSVQGTQSKSNTQLGEHERKKDGALVEKKSISGLLDASDPKIDLASISVLANKALDDLDSKLEIVEKKAGYFVNSITSFFSNASVNKSTSLANRNVDDSSPLPIIPGDAYGSSRYDMELFKLHTTEDLFLDDKLDDVTELSKFVVDDMTEDISSLLSKYSETLEKLMKKLVPTKLTYNKFWFRYFKQESKLRAGEKARKELLSQSDVAEKSEHNKSARGEGSPHLDAQEKANEQVKVGSEVKERKDGKEDEDDDDEEFLWDDEDEIDASDD